MRGSLQGKLLRILYIPLLVLLVLKASLKSSLTMSPKAFIATVKLFPSAVFLTMQFSHFHVLSQCSPLSFFIHSTLFPACGCPLVYHCASKLPSTFGQSERVKDSCFNNWQQAQLHRGSQLVWVHGCPRSTTTFLKS